MLKFIKSHWSIIIFMGLIVAYFMPGAASVWLHQKDITNMAYFVMVACWLMSMSSNWKLIRASGKLLRSSAASDIAHFEAHIKVMESIDKSKLTEEECKQLESTINEFNEALEYLRKLNK